MLCTLEPRYATVALGTEYTLPQSVAAILANAAQHRHGPEPDCGPATGTARRWGYFRAAHRAIPTELRTRLYSYQDMAHDFGRITAGKPQIEEF